MERLYFKCKKKTGQTLDPCNYEDKECEGVMVGSVSCQRCQCFYGIDYEENWVKCLNYGLQCAEAKGNQKEKEKIQHILDMAKRKLFWR